jgi:alpha-tubulin suppressor-like RCC1 family protein
VWAWGCGNDGRLGHGEEEEARPTPIKLGKELFGGYDVAMVACGSTFTVALNSVGAVWTWGAGPLGLGERQRSLSPSCVLAAHFRGSRVATIAAGVQHTLVATIDGNVFAWGRNKCGRLGVGDEYDRRVPTAIERSKFQGDGKMLGRPISFLAAGFNHSVAVSVDGVLFSWGDGCSGKLGLGDRNQRIDPALVGGVDMFWSPVIMAACGGAHTLAVTEEGGLFAWGYGGGGRLGTKDASNRLVPTRVRAQHLGNSKVVMAAAGSSHSSALTEEGALYTWGPGEVYAGAFKNAQIPVGLGHGDTQDKLVPARVPADGVRFGRCRRQVIYRVLRASVISESLSTQGALY